MCDKSAITSNGKKLYLAAFEFISGMYGQVFEKAFYAKDEKQLEAEDTDKQRKTKTGWTR